MNNPQAKEKKLEYSKPQLYSFKDYGAKAGGSCESGSGDAQCGPGNSAISSCWVGYIATLGCTAGTAAPGDCDTGTGH